MESNKVGGSESCDWQPYYTSDLSSKPGTNNKKDRREQKGNFRKPSQQKMTDTLITHDAQNFASDTDNRYFIIAICLKPLNNVLKRKNILSYLRNKL